MTSELVLTTALVARLPDPEINLAAWGIAFVISLFIQSPAVMLLAASTAMSGDRASYFRLRRFITTILAFLTLIHALVAFTPIYGFVVGGLLGAPEEVIAAARIGLVALVPYAYCTGYRRFQQGVLIRHGQSQAVIWGTLIRLVILVIVLAVGYLASTELAVLTAAVAIMAGVVAESVYTYARTAAVIRNRLDPSATTTLTWHGFLAFYFPLVLTTLLTLLVQVLVTAVLGRLPAPLESLAVWPVIFGFLIVWQSAAMGYNEVVISLLGYQGSVAALKRFTNWMALLLTALLLLVTATPLASFWFEHVAGLSAPLAKLARQALWIGLTIPGLRLLLSWYQGQIVVSRQTLPISESVVLFLLITVVVLFVGVLWGEVPGIYVGMAAYAISHAGQVAWLGMRIPRHS